MLHRHNPSTNRPAFTVNSCCLGFGYGSPSQRILFFYSGVCIRIHTPSFSFVEGDLVSSSMIQSARIGTLLWYINGTFSTVRPYPDSPTAYFFCSQKSSKSRHRLRGSLRHIIPAISSQNNNGISNKRRILY